MAGAGDVIVPWEAVSQTALFGVNQSFQRIAQKIHTPEFTVQGMAAKAWLRDADGLCLYKVGKKELPASKILDALSVPHVAYEEARKDHLGSLRTALTLKKYTEPERRL